MERKVISVRVDEDKQDVARKFAQYDLLALPVVDQENRLVGMLTHDDMLDVIVNQATEDVHRLGAVEPGVENHLKAPFAVIWRKRVVWLSRLFVAELFTFTALSHFEDAISSVVVLALFVPLCISTGGNSGSQAATLITRSLALGHVKVSDWLRVLRHELIMGLALGVSLGAIGFVRAALTPQGVLGNAGRWQLALVISQSVMAICLWGTVIGSVPPLLFKRLGIDPGMTSSPSVATFVDVTGIIIYFTNAKLYLL
jgi:magnesium transporter